MCYTYSKLELLGYVSMRQPVKSCQNGRPAERERGMLYGYKINAIYTDL